MTEKRYTITLGKNNEFKEIIDHCRQDKHISVIQFLKQVGEQDKAFKKLKEENKELQERNNRQAKRLDDIYQLIEQKDWRALSDIMDDFKKAEEQLQSEWQTYGDLND